MCFSAIQNASPKPWFWAGSLSSCSAHSQHGGFLLVAVGEASVALHLAWRKPAAASPPLGAYVLAIDDALSPRCGVRGRGEERLMGGIVGVSTPGD
jgi:hypothetical protein